MVWTLVVSGVDAGCEWYFFIVVGLLFNMSIAID